MKLVKWAGMCVLTLALALACLVAAVLVDIEDEADAGVPGGGLKGVPDAYRSWILRAAEDCSHPEITPALLAAQLHQESRFEVDAVSPAGAQGPAQFTPATWATWGQDADGNGRASPHDIGDAVTAQGRYMCSLIQQAKSSGLIGDPRRLALAGYNAGWGAVERYGGVPPYRETRTYVQAIMNMMPRFVGPSLGGDGTTPGARALRRANQQLGAPYSWGGGSPDGPTRGFCDGVNGYDRRGRCAAEVTAGFDCSSLVQYGWWHERHLPRTAAEQYRATADQPVARADLQPGDLLFWANRTGSIYHVALYAGDGRVLHAPRTGERVKVEPLQYAMPAADYYGATRP